MLSQREIGSLFWASGNKTEDTSSCLQESEDMSGLSFSYEDCFKGL